MLLRPDDELMASKLGLTLDEFSCQQAKRRSPVEVFNSFAKSYSFATDKVRETPEFQAFALMTIYYLVSSLMQLR
jgi:hypothetical protein